MTDPGVEVALDARAHLGEGPLWLGEAGRLLWVDILAGRVHLFEPGGEDRVLEVGQPVGAAAPRADGGFVCAVRDGFALLRADGAVEMLAEVEADVPANRMNDGACDSAGRFWAGTMGFDPVPGAGSLYRLDPDGTVTRMLSDVTISNGIDWSPDDRTMYYVDSPTLGLDAFSFDVASGTIEHRRRLAMLPEDRGIPDGLTVDAEGFVWVALFGGGALRRYAPDGELEREVALPVSQPTKPAFGGPGLDELFVTSARKDLSEEQLAGEPAAGAVLRLRPGVAGRPARAFGG